MKRTLMFSILVTADGINPKAYYPCESYPRDLTRACEKAGLATDSSEPDKDDTEEWICETMQPGDTAESIQASGILVAREAFAFLDDAGAIFEDCETMGTLGGPLGGLVPDMALYLESRLVCAHIRITPFIRASDETAQQLTQSSWNRIRKACKETDFYWLSKGHLVRPPTQAPMPPILRSGK